MRLALFDIDDTLIRADCEVLWSRYLTRNGLHDMSRIDEFQDAYRRGTLDYGAFTDFQLAPLASIEEVALVSHRDHFLEAEIRPRVCKLLHGRVQWHQDRADRVLAVSAAHDFLAAPIAGMVGIDEGLYTAAERDESGYTGRVSGQPCFQEGKIARVEAWLAGRGAVWRELQGTWFYSDSHNDLPLLRRVDHPVAVRPDARLRRVAVDASWEVIE
jgi:HAD superfamily hydrolase (TIGR01490 family)